MVLRTSKIQHFPSSLVDDFFPKDLFYEIAKHTPDKDLLSFSQTCKSIHHQLSENAFWLSLSKFRDITVLEKYDEASFLNAKRWYYYEKNLGVKQIALPPKQNVLDKLKIVMVGSQRVGKSQIFSALVDAEFNSKYAPTFGIEYQTRCWQLYDRTAQAQLWDLGGDKQHKAIVAAFSKDANVILFTYSVTMRSTFEEMKKLHNEMASKISPDKMILVANCIDMPKEEHQVTSEEARQFADEHEMQFVEVSAKCGKGIVLLRRYIMEPVPQEATSSSTLSL